MATPIAHNGVTAAVRVIAMTLMDLFLNPELATAAKDYFAEQAAEHQYTPLLGPNDEPAIHLNKEKMDSYRDPMRPVLLRPGALRLLSGAAWDRVPDGPGGRTGELARNRFCSHHGWSGMGPKQWRFLSVRSYTQESTLSPPDHQDLG